MSESHPENTLQKRVDGRWRRIQLYVLMDANRWLLTGLLVLLMFGTLVVLGVVSEISLRSTMRAGDPIDTLFQSFVGAVITGVTVVVTIAQLVLSQETGPLGDQRERLEETVEFRKETDSLFDATSPPEPSSYLRALVEVSRERATRFADDVGEDVDPSVRREVHAFTDALVDNADAVSADLADAHFGEYKVVSAALDFNYSWKIYELRRLRRTYRSELDESARTSAAELLEALQFFAAAREYIKALYIQWSLVDLSRSILSTAIPALVVAVSVLLFVGPNVVPGRTLGVDNMLWLVCGASTVVSSPFLLLVAFILRLATVAKLTADFGPFVLRESERSHDIDWE